jgi:hypothetical protein
MMPIGMEMVEQPLYDTEDLGRIGQRVHLFARPIGQMSPSIWREPRNKDYWETNLVQPGMLSAPSEFSVRDISVLLYDKDGPLPVFDRTGMGNLWAKSYLDFSIGHKLYWQGPLSLVADPVCVIGGLQALIQLPYKNIGETLDFGFSTPKRMLSYQREHALDCYIRNQEYFSVQVTPYTPVCRQVSVRVILNGKWIRPVL